jgi:Icc-related predicted phosphoesterase
MRKRNFVHDLAWALALGAVFIFITGAMYARHDHSAPHAVSVTGTKALTGDPSGYPFHFDAYGDIRFNDRDAHASDPVRRKAIVDAIAHQGPKPDFVTISGDLVLDGSNSSDWAVYDRETAPMRDSGIKIYPALGNHDVRGGPAALANYFEHFPELDNHRWYTLSYGNCFFIMMDSNSDDEPGSTQGNWIATQLEHIPPGVDFIFVMTHHPEYTDSSDSALGGGHSARPMEQSLAHMLESKQATMKAKIIAIGGHVHNYERFEHGGVTYIVSGGGGATPYLFPRSAAAQYKELGPTYHYISFTVDHGKLSAKMHKLEMDGEKPKWDVADKFEIKTEE